MGSLRQLRGPLPWLKPKVAYLGDDKAAASRARDRSSEGRSWYKTQRWRKLRWQVLVRDMFQCQKCQRLETVTSQLVADHKVPHRGDEALFWDEANLWCLCKPCHDSAKQREERAAQARKGWGV